MGVVAIAVVVGGVFLGLGWDDGPTPQSTSSASGPASGPAGTDVAPDAEPDDPATEPDADSEGWLAEVRVAAKDGFPAFVPAEVPAGWTAGSATYVPDTSWHLELTAPSGALVSIDQRSSGTTGDVVDDLLGSAERDGKVNLRRWGTGTWHTFAAGDSAALGKELTGTIVVVSGETDQAELVEITKQLLTAEMAVNIGDGSAG